jgi:hypothetical protein
MVAYVPAVRLNFGSASDGPVGRAFRGEMAPLRLARSGKKDLSQPTIALRARVRPSGANATSVHRAGVAGQRLA